MPKVVLPNTMSNCLECHQKPATKSKKINLTGFQVEIYICDDCYLKSIKN